MSWWHNGVATLGSALDSTFGSMIALAVCCVLGTTLGTIVYDPANISVGVLLFTLGIFAISLFMFGGILLYAYIFIAFVIMAYTESLKLKAGMLASVLVLSGLNGAFVCSRLSFG